MDERSKHGSWRVRPQVKSRIQHVAGLIGWSESQLVDAILTDFVNDVGAARGSAWTLEQWPMFNVSEMIARLPKRPPAGE